MLSLYALSNKNRLFMILICLFHVFQVFLLYKIKLKNNVKITETSIFFVRILYLFILITLIGSVVINGLPSITAFNLSNIYDIREDIISVFPLTYLVPWCCKVILPFLVVYNFDKKKYNIAFLFSIIQIAFFMIYAQKSYLFALIAVFAVYYFSKKRNLRQTLFGGFLIATSIPAIFYNIFGLGFNYLSFFVRRFLFVPAYNKFLYYDFFSAHEKVYFADGLIGNIFGIKSPYQYGITTLIATYEKGSYATGANTGYMADAYANAGIWGMLLIALLMVFLIIFLDNHSKNLNLSVVLGASTTIILSLNDIAFFTALLTGGLIVLALLLYFYDCDQYLRKTKNLYEKN